MHRSKTILTLLIILLITSCGRQGMVEVDNDEVNERGANIAAESFASLSGALKEQIKEGGIEQAVKYCNLAAIPLTDSLSEAHNVDIKRTSFKLRNPENQPNTIETTALAYYQDQIEQQAELKPILIKNTDDKLQYFSPIYTKDVCLNCHGTVGQEIQTGSYGLIMRYYPKDEATGYKSGEWRGMWSITFNN